MAGTTNEDIAAQWTKALTGDWPLLAELSSPTMRVWHSHDDQWMTREQAEAQMAESGAGASPSFQDLRTLVTDTGFVVQASLDGLGAGRIHIVQICTVEDGRVGSCEEYIAPERKLG